MKISTKKSVIFTTLAVMIITAALVIGCMAQVDDELAGWKNEPTAPGTGKVKLSINRNDPRLTILPLTGALGTLNYQVTFSGGSVGGGSYTTPAAITSTSPTISNIPEDTYTTITVIAYKTPGSATTTNVATGSIGNGLGSYTVDNGTLLNLSGATITLILDNPFSATGSGTFSYNIDLSGISSNTLVNADMVITARLGGGGTTPGTNSFSVLPGDDPIGTVPLVAGYYNVMITLENDTSDTTSVFQILHVYQNLVSTFVYNDFDDELFPVIVSSPSTGQSTLALTGPQLPTDGDYSLTGDGGKANLAIGSRFVFRVKDDVTDAILTLNFLPGASGVTLSATDWTLGDGSTSLSPTSITSTQISIEVSNAVGPWAGKTQQFPTYVFFTGSDGKTYVTPPIYIQLVDAL